VLKPVCNDKRCPGKTCKGEQQGRSWYATTGGAGVCALAWRVYKAYRAGTTVALADLVDMGVRELAGRDPKTQVDVKRDDLLRYEGKVGLCESCTPRTEGGRAKHTNRPSRFNRAGWRKRAAEKAAAAGAGAGPST